MATAKNGEEIKFFTTAKAFETWLKKNQEVSGVWLQLYKKDSGVKSLDRAGALDVALCYGWIDGQANKHDDQSYLQRFCPRRPKSLWSKVNIDHVARLTEAGRMQAAGHKAIEEAKADGRWAAAYDPPSSSETPADFIALLKKNKVAYAFFKTLNKTNLFAINWRLQTAKKAETREKRMLVIIGKLERGERFH
ncbi:YdeI/OmpD-associated family protein [Chitinophaga horti]|uniref:YdeI/OmpD-associated family protein n=1 Tax=Chitinophaga horti TaxID=2920382 RepID=A0ABY6J8T0_9BACT|nr:YdeI/OmpD-associated family protein [Chitinophaga horti]UYQ94987.1 YdeI/OmpD-associated family protein [Chitinophaga horti]